MLLTMSAVNEQLHSKAIFMRESVCGRLDVVNVLIWQGSATLRAIDTKVSDFAAFLRQAAG